MASRLDRLVYLLALPILTGSYLLVEGEEVISAEIESMLTDPRMQELYELAEQMELSIMQTIDDGLFIVTAFFDYPEKRVVLAISQGDDLYSATLKAISNAVDRMDEEEAKP